MSKFAGKTLVITGGSSGIGAAIGERLQQEGANLVILAKDDIVPNSERTLALNVDVRNEAEVQAALRQANAKFGSIDSLINNVSAFCFTDTVETSPDEFDLMFAVNVRATFMLSKLCHDYLKKAKHPHILTISPPLDMNARWFKHHLAFTMSKFGMSMCTLGMANEFKSSGIGVNSLWPQTTIATPTIENHCTPEVYAGSRLPSIMADAAHEILMRDPRQCTGNFFIDENVLREAGVTDFAKYAVDANTPLIQDLFVPGEMPGARQFNQDLFTKL